MNLAEQLKNVKLKAPKEPVKDYSSPRMCGFISEREITDYQNSVLDVNTEQWLEALSDVTFLTEYCPIDIHEAEIMITLFERLYKNLDPVGISKVEWRDNLTADENNVIRNMTDRLSTTIMKFTSGDGFAFVKTSCRSPKDAPLAQTRFKKIVNLRLTEADDSDSENTRIICLLQAAFEAMKVKTADEALDMMFRSERVYQDMLLAVQIRARFRENFVVRQFVHIDVDMEFRGFVYKNKLVALSQYNYLIYSTRLVERKEKISKIIKHFFYNEVKPRIMSCQKIPENYIVDFALCDEGQKVWVIEINPFLQTTDGALFSWEHERHLLEGEDFVFRIVERLKPGAMTMLPLSIKTLLL